MTSRAPLALSLLCSVVLAHGQDLDRPLHIGGSVKAPVLVHQVDPDVSKISEAERRKFHGCSVFLVVDTEGVPKRLRIEGPSGSPEVDAAVLEAVRQYRFRPATRDGVAVAVELYMNENIDFF